MRTTGVGSMPGTSFAEATRIVATTQSVVAFPELPARPDSDMISRALGLSELPVERCLDGWRLSRKQDGAHRRAARWWRNDFDDFEEFTQGEFTQGMESPVKIAITGPWTLATCLRLPHPTMDHVLADPIAVLDVAQGMGEAVGELVARFASRFPNELIIQIDEPALAGVLDGALPTTSGMHRYRRPDRGEIIRVLREVCVPGAWLHSCGGAVPLDLLKQSGFHGISCPLPGEPQQIEVLEEWIGTGGALAAGVVDTRVPRCPGHDEIAARVLTSLRHFAMDPGHIDDSVLLTPECGLASWALGDAGRCFETLDRAAGIVSAELA